MDLGYTKAAFLFARTPDEYLSFQYVGKFKSRTEKTMQIGDLGGC